ncbi:MAG: COX15/CtaA family protein [Phycisphaerales bacterium]|nr:COX15/CtaA family protein [Phycisphaerales bacterium]MCB9835488.1 COX15/CtaA family protein [Phycisphaera sp.]
MSIEPADAIAVKQESSSGWPIWPGVVVGFMAAIAMWLVWYPLHLPGLRVPTAVAGPLLLAVLVAMIACKSRAAGSRAVAVGVVAGLVSAGVNLLLLGNQLTEAGATPAEAESAKVRPDAALIVGGFVLVSLLAGLVGGLIGRKLAKPGAGTRDWIAAFGAAAVASMLPLVAAGGAVTSAGAGMAVPDWPGTYGSNMFLYPIGLMADPRIFLEHTHRLFGTLVGLTTLSLMIAVLISRKSKLSKTLAVVVFVGVCIQGVLGAIRVTEINPGFGIIHGILAQLILCTAAILAASLTRTWREKLDINVELARSSRKWTDIAIGGLFLQLILAAMYRHLGSGHAIMTHAGFAIIATMLLLMSAFSLIKIAKESSGNRTLKRVGMFMMHGVGLQIVLGIVAFVMLGDHGASDRVVMHDKLADAPPLPLANVLIATAHQLLGACLLMASALAAVWVRRVRASGESA